jgi:hypothetical protein
MGSEGSRRKEAGFRKALDSGASRAPEASRPAIADRLLVSAPSGTDAPLECVDFDSGAR